MSVEKYDAATLTIGGVEVTADTLSVERSTPETSGRALLPQSVEMTMSLDVDMPTFCAAFESLFPREAVQPIATGCNGNASTASLFTLAKRTSYGGRKGRRAVHRVNVGQWGPTPVIIEPYGQTVAGFDLQAVEETRS